MCHGEIGKLSATLIPVLAKLSLDDPTKWHKHVTSVRKIIDSMKSATTKFSPFELMAGVKMKNKDDIHIKQIRRRTYQISIS